MLTSRREDQPTIETCRSKTNNTTRGTIETTMTHTKSLESKEEADPITKEVAVEAITKKPTTMPEWFLRISNLYLFEALSLRDET